MNIIKKDHASGGKGDTMEISYSKQAIKFLLKQDEKSRNRIISAINKLPMGDVKSLIGYNNKYRLRVGDYRIIFDKDGTVIYIEKIANRGQAYKGV